MPVKKISDDAIGELQKINWTGNIREFRNVIERLIILCGNDIDGKDVLNYAQPLKWIENGFIIQSLVHERFYNQLFHQNIQVCCC